MQFITFGKYICEQLRAKGFWADYIDPCSGLPMISLNCNKVYSEVDGMECLLNYKAYNAGFCKILTHPKWGSAVYPATIFAHAPADIVRSLIESLPAGDAILGGCQAGVGSWLDRQKCNIITTTVSQKQRNIDRVLLLCRRRNCVQSGRRDGTNGTSLLYH